MHDGPLYGAAVCGLRVAVQDDEPDGPVGSVHALHGRRAGGRTGGRRHDAAGRDQDSAADPRIGGGSGAAKCQGSVGGGQDHQAARRLEGLLQRPQAEDSHDDAEYGHLLVSVPSVVYMGFDY